MTQNQRILVEEINEAMKDHNFEEAKRLFLELMKTGFGRMAPNVSPPSDPPPGVAGRCRIG